MLPNCLKDLCVKMPRFRVLKFFLFSSLLFLSAGASHARLPTPPQAQQDLLVLTMPAPQGSRVACWVPHFSEGIPATAVGLPQECFLTTASVTGTNREQERESEKGNTVIRSEETEASHTAALTNWKTFILVCPRLLLQHLDWAWPQRHKRHVSWVVFVTSHHCKCQMSWNLPMSVVTIVPSGSVSRRLVFPWVPVILPES